MRLIFNPYGSIESKNIAAFYILIFLTSYATSWHLGKKNFGVIQSEYDYIPLYVIHCRSHHMATERGNVLTQKELHLACFYLAHRNGFSE